MKKGRFSILLVFLFSIIISSVAYADFAERPAAFVVFDRSGNVTASVLKIWQQPVKWAYHFPDFKVVDNAKAKQTAAEEIFSTKGKPFVDAAVMERIAQKAELEALVLVIVDELDENMVQRGLFSFGFEDASDYLIESTIDADIFLYRRDGARLLHKRVFEHELEPQGNQLDVVDTMKWAICKLINTMEGRPIIH